MGNCVHLRVRTKKGVKYLYCTKNRSEVNLVACSKCSDKEYKKVTPIKKIRKTKETVSKETYDKVFERDRGECIICGSRESLQLHHINGRGKNKTDNPHNCVMLCAHCHLDVVHKNMKVWTPVLIEMVDKKLRR